MKVYEVKIEYRNLFDEVTDSDHELAMTKAEAAKIVGEYYDDEMELIDDLKEQGEFTGFNCTNYVDGDLSFTIAIDGFEKMTVTTEEHEIPDRSV